MTMGAVTDSPVLDTTVTKSGHDAMRTIAALAYSVDPVRTEAALLVLGETKLIFNLRIAAEIRREEEKKAAAEKKTLAP